MILDAALTAPVADWATAAHPQFQPNGPGRQFGILDRPDLLPPPEVWAIKALACADLLEAEQEPVFRDFCGYITDGGAVHPHTDPAPKGKKHVRVNVLVSRPEQGGVPVQNGVELDVPDGGVWRCEASASRHWCTPVVGAKPRIVLSFGFLI